MNNVVDRVPTEVLANGAVRWEQFDSSGNSLGYVYLKRADEPTEAGTPINKVLFDSIGTDLTNLSNNKYDISSVVTGTFNWQPSTDITITLGFKPRFVMIISDPINENIDQTTGYNMIAFLLNNMGVAMRSGIRAASDYSNHGLSNTYTAYWKTPITNTGFIVKGYNYVISMASYAVSATYIAFK